MSVSDLDIFRSANLYLELHGAVAIPKARAMVETMRERGDEGGVEARQRIILAIETPSRGQEGPPS